MNEQIINWDAVPEVINKEQFFRLCHISKTTALHLLRSRIVPCTYSGKKTRSYSIKKSDVKVFLESRAIYPEAYSAPVGWYCSGHKLNAKEVPPKVTADMQEFFEEKLSQYKSDVLRTKDVCTFTGYGRTTVNRWCKLNKLKSIGKEMNLIPKVFLIDFLNSITFRAINIKSKKHIAMLKEFVELQKQLAKDAKS